MWRREKVSSARAAAAVLPRIRRATRLSLRGLVCTPRRRACASFSARMRGAFGLPISAPPRLLVAGVTIEGPGRSELAEFVADHILGHQDRDELVAVINAEGQPDELGEDRRAARLGADHRLAPGRRHLLRLLEKIAVDEWPFPYCARHAPLRYLLWRRRRIRRSVALLCRVFLPLVGCPQGVTGWRPPEVRPSPPPWGWSTGFIATPRTDGRRPSQRLRPALPMTIF